MHRVYGLSIALVSAIGLAGGCVGVPEPSPNMLDPRLAWPCHRLTVAWPAKVSEVQALMGTDVTQRTNDGLRTLQLSVMRCDRPTASRAKEAPLLYATVTVPITADSTPLVITSVAADGWWALPHIFADDNTSAVFARMGYEVIAADISFQVDRRGAESKTIQSQLILPNGRIQAAATVTGNAMPHEASIALLENGADSWSAFFGQEQAERYSSVLATLDIEGETPLSMFDLPPTPAMALFDEALVSNRVLWRLPNSKD